MLAPVGRDAQAIGRVLADTGLAFTPAASLQDLCTGLSNETLLLVIAEEGLGSGTGPLLERLAAQPSWSDLPIIILGAGGPRRGSDGRWKLFEELGNVTVMDRPLHVGALQSAARAALRARDRQYETRGHLRELEAAQLGLEERVAERTRQLELEISERQTIQAALLRSQRLEAIGQLTGGVAHDFNNLLQVVIGGVSMLERHHANPERRVRILDGMRQAGERGAKLTQQMLAFARRQPLAPEPLDVAVGIGAMEELLQGSLRGDLRLTLNFPTDLWPVETDLTQLEVAILNLVVNARDATSGEGRVTIGAENVADPHSPEGTLDGDFVRISVADTGSGMDEDTIQHAFEPFFTTKPVGRGTGLGLSQVYGFARQSGGGVHIETEVGRGTTVSIVLPRAHRALLPKTAETAQQPEHAGGLVLVVEDEDQVASMACEMLRELGYECERAVDAAAALRLDLSRFAGVFSDVLMPGRLDGIGMAEELRRRRPELPILLTTGFAGAPDRISNTDFPVLMKPYTRDELSRAASLVFSLASAKPANSAAD